ncbi:GNAT family N-acetyltransferase [Hoeflea sp.]|uniref:GNAT family N-acetyltransferase n=1 Tax=Hoeflea sp. TaxID=1940281 RepID=UPI003BB1ABB1
MTFIDPVSSSQNFILDAELPADLAAREALLDRAMGPERKRKSSEMLRRGRLPSEGLALVARDMGGNLVGTVRLWDVTAGAKPLLLLGPLSADPSMAGLGIGSALMRRAISLAAAKGHGAIVLVGDAPYYKRFGFASEKAAGLLMPGPVERERFLGLELVEGYLGDAAGLLTAAGRHAPIDQDLGIMCWEQVA